MRTEQLISIHLIKVDRFALEKKTLDIIFFKMSGGKVPAIKVARLPHGGYVIRDGRHRITAAKIMGETTILARFSNEPLRVESKSIQF